MEQRNNLEIAVTDDNLYQTMQDNSNLDDATIRRMKNRERQRRYRARKRLEADSMNEITYQPLKRHEGNANNMQMVPVPVPQEVVYYPSSNNGSKASPDGQLVFARINELPLVVTTPNTETRVPSRRDWKSDARRANSDEQDNRRFSLDIGSKMGSFSSVVMEDVALINNGESSVSVSESGEMLKSGPGRRHWKTEARNRGVEGS